MKSPLTFTDTDMRELRRRRRDDAFTTWLLAIVISIIAVFVLSPHQWKECLFAWICGGGFLSTYESWRKLRG